MNKLVVDGSNLAYMFLYVSGITEENCDNPETQGLFYSIYMNKLYSYFKTYPSKDIYLIWDSPTGTKWRKEIFESYKGNRRAKQKDDPVMKVFFKTLLPTLKELLKSFPIYIYEHPLAEGDDIIYALCKMFSEAEDITVVSADGDMKQLYLHFDNITLYNPRAKKVEPKPDKDFIKLKAIVGDVSDNIPGLYKVGPKTAPKYLNGEKHFNDEQETLYKKFLKIVDLSQFGYVDKVIEDFNTYVKEKTLSFNPDYIEKFMIDNNMNESYKRWPINKEIINRSFLYED